MNVWPVVAVAAPIAAAALGALVRRWRNLQRVVVVAGVSAVVLAGMSMVLRDGQSTRAVVGDAPARFGIVLLGDPFAALLVLAAGVLTLAVVGFAIAGGEDRHPFLTPLMLVMLAGSCGSFLAADLFHLFVVLEMTLASSYVLATIQATRRQVRAGVVYIATNILASMFVLTAIAWIYASTGTVNMGVLAERSVSPPLTAGALLITALGVKAAVIPLGGWLPVSYPVVPRSVAGLFAGLLTTVGVAAIYRLHSLVLHDDPRIRAALLAVAAVTCLVAAVAATSRSSPEETLGFVLVAQVGFMLLGVGLSGELGLAAGVFFIVQDVLIKTAAFLSIGTARDAIGSPGTSTGQVRPLLAASALVAGLSLTGVPPTSGFVGKLLLLRAAEDVSQPLIIAAALISSLAVLVAVLAAGWRLFETQREDLQRQPSDPSPRRLRWGRTGPVILLVTATMIIGLQPSWLTDQAQQAAGWLERPSRYAEAVLR